MRVDVEIVQDFTYLGSNITSDGEASDGEAKDEVKSRIGKALLKFQTLTLHR